jgi:hypothetical protein
LPQAIRNISVQFDRHFSTASLRLDDDCQSNPFAVRAGCRHFLIFDVPICWSPICNSMLCYSMISKA